MGQEGDSVRTAERTDRDFLDFFFFFYLIGKQVSQGLHHGFS